MESPPNVLLIVMDCVRAEDVSVYPGAEGTTPFLEKYSENSTVYRQARSPGLWSLPSHYSIFTGYSQPEHKMLRTDVADPEDNIFYRLSNSGYRTGLFTSNRYVLSHGLKDGFDDVYGEPDEFSDEYVSGKEIDDSAPDGFYYADRFVDWSDDGHPWAACINLMDAHEPYEPRDSFDRRDELPREIQRENRKHMSWKYHGGLIEDWEIRSQYGLYRDGINQVDSIVERIVNSVSDDTLVVITGDHGQGFIESSPVPDAPPLVSHSAGLSEQLLHVPLIVSAPNQDRSGVLDKLATLSEFPSAVNDLGVKEYDDGAFAVDECYAGRCELMDDVYDVVDNYVDNVEMLSSNAKIYYEDMDGRCVRKVACWNDSCAEIVSAGPGCIVESSVLESNTVEEYDEVEQKDLFDKNNEVEMEADDEEVRDRLEDLGYI